MTDLSTKLQIAVVVMLLLVAGSLSMNTCAMDRLEDQVIRNTKAVERLESSGGVGGRVIAAAPSAGGAPVAVTPGTGAGFTATGWGGNTAEILHVEGAEPGAPLTLAQKPRPQGDTYVNRRGSPPSSLNFYATSEGATGVITRHLLGRLIDIDPDAPPDTIPGLATRWEISDDKLTYTYHLRRGVRFADGRPFTSKDVLFSFDVMRDPEVKADHMRGTFEDVVEMATPDDYTVVVTYRTKYWRGLYAVGHDLRILNKGWYEEQIPAQARKLDIAEFSIEPGKPGFGEVFNKIRIPCPGTGAYYYAGEEYVLGEPVVLRQNPFYYGIQVHPKWFNLRQQKWIYISDEVSAFEEFRKEKFDVTVVEFQPWDDEYSADADIAEISNYFEYDHMALGASVIAWNNRQPPFDDARVRRAMTHLTNRAWMLEELNRGRGAVANFPSKPIYPEYQEKEPIPFDIDAARALLAEAGWEDTDGDGVLDRDGVRFEFELKVPSGRRFYTQVGSVLEDACKQVGIRVTVRALEWATFINDLYERRFDAVCLYNSHADPWIDPYDGVHSTGDVPYGNNTAGWRNPEVDELVERMREEFDYEKRTAMFQEFNEIFYREQPVTLLMHSLVGVIQNKRFEDVTVRPTGLRIYDFWVKPENVRYE